MAEQHVNPEALTALVGQLRASLNRIDDACLALDKELCCVFANDAATTLLQQTQQSLMQQRLPIDQLPFFSPEVIASYKQAIATQEQQFIETPGQNTELWYAHRIYPDQEGISVFIETLKGYEHTSLARLEATQSLQRLMEELPHGMLLADIETRHFVYANKAICEMYGYTPKEFEALSPVSLHPPYETHRVVETFEHMIEGKTSIISNLDALHKDGHVFTVDVSAVVVTHKGRQCISGLFKDVTEEKKLAEQEAKTKAALAYNELILRQAQDIGNMGSWEIRHEDYHISWSDTTYRIFDCSPATLELTHQSFMSMVHPEDAALVDVAFSDHIEHRAEFNIVFRIITAEQKLKYVHEKCKTEYDASGKPVRTIGIVMDITKQRMAELALKEEQQNYQALIEHAPVGMVAISGEEHVFFGNRKFQSLTGYTPADIENLHDWWQNAYPDEAAKQLAQKNWDLLTSNPSKKKASLPPIETAILCKNGETKYMEVGYVYARNFHLLTFVDVTQRKLAEDALAANEAKFRQIAEQMTDMVWIGDLNYRSTYVSPSVEKLYGLTVEEYATYPLEKRFPPHSIEIFKKTHDELLAELLKNPGPQSREATMEIEAYKKDGTPIWVSSTIKVLCNDKGEPISFMGVTSDITARKNAEMALATSESRYRLIFDASPIGMLITDKNDEVIMSNRRFTAMLGYSYADAAARTEWLQKAYPDEAYRNHIFVEWQKAIAKAKATQTPILSFEAYITCKNGEPRYFQLGYMPGNDVNIITYTDIHDLKMAKQAISKASANLQNLMSNLPQGVGILNKDNKKFEFVNQAMCNMFGYTAEEFKQLTPINLHPDYEQAKVKEDLVQMDENMRNFSLLLDAIDKNGNIFQLDVFPLQVEYNGTTALAGVYTDVTEKTQAIKALRAAKDKAEENELLLKQAQRIAMMGSWTFDHVLNQLQWSDSIFDMLELIPQSIVPSYETYLSYVHPDDKNKLDEAFTNHVLHKTPYEIKHRLLLQSGNIKYMLATGITDYDTTTGAPMYTIGVMTDITKQALAEQELLQAKQDAEARELILKQVQKIALTGYWEHNHITGDVTCSVDVYEIFEIDPNESTPNYSGFFKLLPQEDAKQVEIAYQKHLKEKTPYDVTHRIYTTKGDIKYVHERCITFYDEQGNPTKSLGVIADITAEQKATEESNAQKLYIESLLEAIPDLMFVLDANGYYTAFKSANDSNLLLPADLFVGKHYSDVLPADLSEKLEKILEETRQQKHVDSWEYSIIIGDERKYFDAKLQLLDNGSMLILSRDVTQAKNAALLLEESEQKYRSVFEATPVGLVAISLTGEILLFNHHFNALTGYSKTDIPDIETWWRVAYPDEEYRKYVQSIWNEELQKAATSSNIAKPGEFSIVCKNGTARYFEIGFVISNGINLVSFNDVHDKKTAQLKLAESENKFRQIAETVNEVFWLRSSDLKQLLYINPAYEKVFGRKVDDLYKEEKFFLKAIHPDDQEKVWNNFLQYRETLQFDMEYRIVKPNGEIRWIRNKSLPVRNEQGEVIAHTGTAVDVTDRKIADIRLKNQEEFQHLLMLLATEFINAPVEKFSEVMNELLKKVGMISNVDRAYVFEHDYNNNTSSNTYEWCADNIVPQIQNLQQLPFELYKDILAAHREGEVYHIPNVEALKENKALYNHITAQGIKSLAVIPMLFQKTVIGFIGFDAVLNYRSFKPFEIQLLQVLAEIVTNALMRRKNESIIIKSEHDYKVLFDNMAQGVVYQVADGQIIKANPAASRILGVSMNQLMGRSSYDPDWHAIHEDGSPYPGEEHPTMVALRSGKSVRNKVMGVYHPQAKQYRWLLVNADPEFDEGQTQPSRVFATFTDITDRKLTEAEIRAQAALQKMLMEIAATYINIPLAQLDQSIHQSLGAIGKFVQADRAYIFDYNFEAQNCSNTYEWCAEGITAEIMNLQQVPLEGIPFWVEKHKKGLPFIIHDVSKLDDVAQKDLKELLSSQNIQSLITLPLIDDDELLGFIGFDAVKQLHEFSEKEQQLLLLYTQVLLNVKKRLTTENSLEENKRFLENVIDNSGSMIYVKNVDGTYRAANKQWVSITGYTRDQTIGKTDVQLFGFEQARLFSQIDQRVLKTGQTIESEEQLVTPEGIRYFISIKFPLKDNEGKITGVCGMSTEITERKQAEILLKENEERLVQLTTTSRTFAWETDANGKYTYVSNVVTAVLGYLPEDLVGKKNYYDLIPAPENEDFKKAMKHVFFNKDTFTGLEKKAVQKNGNIIWLATTGTPLLDAQGQLIGYRGGDTDITSKKNMELALVKSESVYRLLADNSTDVIWLLDINTMRLTYVSPGCMELRGYTVAESIAQPVEESMTAESFVKIQAWVSEALDLYAATGKMPASQMMEIEQFHKNGSRIWVEVVAKLQLNIDGKLEVLGVSRNVSERKKVEHDKLLAQEALKESESRLEAIIETTSDNIWSINNQYEILYINGMFRKAFEQSFGYILEKGDNILNSLPEPFKQSWKIHYDYVLQNKERIKFEEQYDFPTGSMWVEVSMFPIISNGDATGVSCFGKDITTQKNAEIALAESEERFRTIFRDNASVMLLIDPEDASILESNPAAAKFYGWSEEKFKTLKLTDISLHPHKTKEKIATALEKKNVRYEMIHQLSNGTLREMEVFSSLISIGGRTVIHEIIHDISDKKKAEADLIEKNKQLNLLIQNIPGVVFNCINNDNNRMHFINDYIQEITGYNAREINETAEINYRKLIHPEDLPKFDLAIEEAYQQRQRYNHSYRLLSKDGSYKWVYEIGEFQSYDGNSYNKRIDGIIFDITDRISNEEQKLTAAYDAAEAERTRISHEIHDGIQQTLVASKLSIASLRKDINQLGDRTIEKFNNGLQLLDQGINEARSIAHSLMPKQVNDYGFSIAVEHLISNLDKEIKVEFTHPGLMLNDSKFGTNLFRITQEAINNIIKHAHATKITITLSEAGNRLILTISDNGTGFDKASLASPERGIGMQIMASRAAAMNANFDVATATGKGTTIIVDVPYE